MATYTKFQQFAEVLFAMKLADPWTGTMGKLSEMYPKQVVRYGSYRRAI